MTTVYARIQNNHGAVITAMRLDLRRALRLQRTQALGVRYVHAAILSFPVVQRGFRDAVLARQVGRLRSGFMLAQNHNDLLFSEPDPLQCPSPCCCRTLKLRVGEKLSGR